MSFQWFYWWICISLRGLRLFSHVTWLGTGQFRWSIGTNGTIGTNRKWCNSNGSIGEYASHWRDLDYFLMWSGWVQGNSDGPLVSMVSLVSLVSIENDVIPMVLSVNKARSKYKHAMCILRSISRLCKISSLLHQVKIYYEYSSFYKLTTQNNFALTESRNALIVIMNIPRSLS